MVRTGLTAQLGVTRMGAVARPWEDIRRHYEEIPNAAARSMAALVSAIATSEYPVAGLFGATSMGDLYLGRSAAIFDNPHLIISAVQDGQELQFTYNDGSRTPWSRRSAPAEGYEVLKWFLIKRARWFRNPRRAHATHDGRRPKR